MLCLYFYVSVRSLTWWSVYLFVPWSEEAVQPSRDIFFLPITFFAQHANGRPRKSSEIESSGSNFWFSIFCVQRIEFTFHPYGLM